MQNSSIESRQRLSFAPYLAPFAMSFAELNKSIWREEQSNNKIQKLINNHTHEDDHHWVWFLKDIEKLGFNQSMNLNDALKLLWSERLKTSRKLVNELYRYTFEADPILKLVAIEVCEATGNVMFSAAAQVGEELQATTKKELRYFSKSHLEVETGHATGTPDVEKFIANIQLTEETLQQAFELVEKLFEVFVELMDELLAYAKNHNVCEPNTNIVKFERPLQAA